MYAPGTRRHIQGALKAGATPEEIMTVLQICVFDGRSSVRQRRFRCWPERAGA